MFYALLQGEPPEHFAPLPRNDGFFDWVFLQPSTNDLFFLENDSTKPELIARNLPAEDVRGTSAARLADGTTHVILYDVRKPNQAGLSQPSQLIHAWWTQDTPGQFEVVAAGDPFAWPFLKANKNHVVITAPHNDVSVVYHATSGAFTSTPFPMRVFAAIPTTSGIAACVATERNFAYLTAPYDSPTFDIDDVMASAAAKLSFSCPVTLVGSEPLLILSGTELAPGIVEVQNESLVATRDEEGWSIRPMGFWFHSGEDLVSPQGVPIHLGETGNGTSTGNERNGTELRTPVQDPNARWLRFWGNFGRSAYFLDHESRILVVGEVWANAPFRFSGRATGDEPLNRFGAVVDVPFPASP